MSTAAPLTHAPRLWALIPCAGNGSRSGADGPKQYHPIAGQPMVQHTLAAFAAVPELAGTLVVVAADDQFFAAPDLSNDSYLIANCGGSTRALSVFNGLNHLLSHGATATDWVLVHDAARCLISPVLIQRLINACRDDEVGGLLAQPLPDTLKSERADNDPRVAQTIPRDGKWLAQTPQMFRIGALIAALEHAGDRVTDESSAIEAMGLHPRLVPGSAQNFKVTYPEDFALAQALLRSRLSDNNEFNQGLST